MHDKGSIQAVNLHLRDFTHHIKFDGELSRTARFAKSKLAAKFEEPTSDNAAERRKDAWSRWIGSDGGLQRGRLLGPHWAKARLIVHEILDDFHLGDLVFTNGSSFEPLGNRVSVACKLTETWTITHDCFDLFAKYSYWHRALKFSCKKRFESYCRRKGLSLSAVNKKLYRRFRFSPNIGFEAYKFKLWCVVTFVQGNRWSTVPKNNLKDRSICLEPLCNMLVQRAVGLGIRACLRDKLGIDLDTLANHHRSRISDPKVATIDLSDCSDTISIWLTEYLLPKRVLNKVLASRSVMTLGPDDNFYVINKVSSMGNGYTFDLMTLILTALTRSFDPTSTVFGDDIICQNQVADDVVDSLKIAGFTVNQEKTLINSDYRESCGAHFIDGEGYITVFDIRWLKTLHDLIVACNKVAILSYIYGEPFTSLMKTIWTCVPVTLLGATVERPTVHMGRPPSYDLDTYIRYGPTIYVNPKKNVLRTLRRFSGSCHKTGRYSVALGVECRLAPASHQLSSQQWDVFFQYIRNSRLSRKIPRMVFKSTLVARVGEEQIDFVRALLPK